MSSSGKRFRSSSSCTVCRQLKMKCDRKERLPNRCTRCEKTDQTCELSTTFERKRMKGPYRDDEETRRLRQELEQLKAQVATLKPHEPIPQTPEVEPDITSPSLSAGSSIRPARPHSSDITIQRSANGIIVLPWQIDTSFATFFRQMHPFLPFLEEVTPNACYEKEPFLFWTICMLGLRSFCPELSKAIGDFVAVEALQAPIRCCHNQAAAAAVVQGLLLLSLWPFACPSLLHEAAWIHCGSATHLALHIGFHQPYAASEFVPKREREHIPNSFTEFRRTWIATAEKLSISPDLFKALLIARRIEEGQDLGHSRTGTHGQIDPGSREGIFRLLQSRISDTEKRASPLSPYISMIITAAKLQPAIQVLQSTTPISLQETTVLSACDNACQVITFARMVQGQTNMVHLPVFVDSLVLMSAVLIFKIHISRFSSLINGQVAQSQISEACSYFHDGINDFSDVPNRVGIFVEALYTLVAENLVPVGGFVIENTKSRYSQNILYEVLWTFKEWKRQKIEAATIQQEQTVYAPINPNPAMEATFSFLDADQLDHGFWQMVEGL
ncbi:hypothetical protein BP6252_08749 [Coleophoma cylindrospora]|uniref:Zn(2)-C6 fungal-type domain-containing protein n=1 Tax=Coleophoma cylindrospora TaxID=1849047 RepID=A0A3D8R6R3_9HELO|nr:hypothetical protein BP6252_08749 [Coleophoma cylindrospora]